MKKKYEHYYGFEDDLKKHLEDPEFKKLYDEFGVQLEIAHSIIKMRNRANMSQAQLAKKVGTTQSNIARIEAGNQNLSTRYLQKVAHALGKTVKVKFV